MELQKNFDLLYDNKYSDSLSCEIELESIIFLRFIMHLFIVFYIQSANYMITVSYVGDELMLIFTVYYYIPSSFLYLLLYLHSTSLAVYLLTLFGNICLLLLFSVCYISFPVS